jgi:class 3 adenylate cyclase
MVMQTELPLPEDPRLKQAATAIRDSQQWSTVYDSHFRLIWASEAQIRAWGDDLETALTAMGRHILNPFHFSQRYENLELWLKKVGEFVLADTPGGKEELRELVNPNIRHLVDEMHPDYSDFISIDLITPRPYGTLVRAQSVFMRVRDDTGRFVGAISVTKPGGDAYTMAEMVSILSPRVMVDLHSAARASRKPAAILCADLEGSFELSRSLSTDAYFRLTRRLVFAADHCVVAAGGLVGRHAGDGVTAFFLAENFSSEATAAMACLSASRALNVATTDIAVRSGVDPRELVLRFGLHWGSKLFVGAITTEGRFEVTAMGDEVNEAARIEACATGGLTLASKDLIERLTSDDALELGLDTSRLKYTRLADLASASEKARRDAPTIAVCAI